MATNIVFENRTEYTIQHEDFSPLIIDEPIGWESDEKEFSRNEDYHGIFIKHSNNLKFIGDGADYLTTIYEVYGINSRVILRKRERHPHTNLWEISYYGYLDMSTYRIENNQVSVKFNSSGLEQALKNRQNEKVEIDRLDTIDGTTLEPLIPKQVLLKGRSIFLRSVFKAASEKSFVSVETNVGGTRNQIASMPITLDINQHENLLQTPNLYTKIGENQGDPYVMFLLDIDRDRTIDFSIKGKTDVFFSQYEDVQWCRYKICVTIYENGFDFDVKKRYVIKELRSENPIESDDPANSLLVLPSDYPGVVPPFTINDVTFEFNQSINLLKGESMAFEAYLKSDMYTSNTAGVRTETSNFQLDTFSLREDSYFQQTVSKMFLNFELGERLINIITNRKGIMYSEALGRTDIGYAQDGINTGALNGFAHGFWIRGFDKDLESIDEEEENRFKPLTTSFKDWMDNLKATWNLGLGIERIGFSERVIIENLKYFYNNNVLIRLGKEINGKFEYVKVSNVRRSIANEYYYSSLLFGYEKGWDNEEAQGLDEYNAQTRYLTNISVIKNDYEMISPYVGGVYPKEFSRRKQFNDYPTTDHSYDKDVFVMDLKRGINNVFEERVWQDDFEEEPTGTFRADNATNLRLSPLNMKLRHGWVISAGLQKHYPEKYVKYISSEANSKLTTNPIGGERRSEQDDIMNSELERPRYFPEWIEFDCQVDFLMMKQIEGYTEILGKKIPNYYGLVEFKNENNQLEKGYLFNLKPFGKGEWKILKANR